MELTKREMQIAKEALGYGVMFSNNEAETAEFAMLKIKIESEILKQEQNNIPEFCPVCGRKCSGVANSIKNGEITERTFFHYKANSKNCIQKKQ